jgi:hypothetical protein
MTPARLRLPAQLSELNVGRGPAVVALLHPGHCAACRRWQHELQQNAHHFAEWDARLLFTNDVESSIAPALWIADEWSEVFFHWQGEHDFPALKEIVDWVRFIAIQCPECEQPEGEWRNL